MGSAILDGEAVADDANEGIQAVFHERGPLWNARPMWCPWYGKRITLGVVTPGGIEYHAACWRRRVEMVRAAARQG